MFIATHQIQLNHLYQITLPLSYNGHQGAFKPFLFINSGTVDVYGSSSLTQPTSLSNLVLEGDATAIEGYGIFELIPSYIVVKQNTGTTTEIILSGLEVKDLGEL